jgi:hypothetical protein
MTCDFASDNGSFPLTCYNITDTPTTPFIQPLVRVFIPGMPNQIDGCPTPRVADLKVLRPHSVCVPTVKEHYPLSRTGFPFDPFIDRDNLTNHYKCYAVQAGSIGFDFGIDDFKLFPGIDNLSQQQVRFSDQFLPSHSVRFTKTALLCAPVNKNNATQPDPDAVNPAFPDTSVDHLLCGTFRATRPFKSRYIQAYNQFFPNGQRLYLKSPNMGCIPVAKICGPGPGFGCGCDPNSGGLCFP